MGTNEESAGAAAPHSQGLLLERDRYAVNLSVTAGKVPVFLVKVDTKDPDYPGCHLPLGMTRQPTLSLDHMPTIEFTRESRWHRLAKATRTNRETQTGDAEFDDAVYIHSSAPARYIEAVLSEQSTRDAIRQLLQGDYLQVEVHSPSCLVLAMGAAGGDAQLPTAPHPDIDRITRIAEALPGVEVRSPFVRAHTRDQVLVWGALLLSAPLAMFGMVTDDWWQTLGQRPNGFEYGAIAWATVLPTFLLSMRGFSNSLKNFGLAALLAGIGLLTGTDAVMRAVNAGFDSSEKLRVQARVTDKKHRSGKGSYNRLWLAPQAQLPAGRVDVDYDLYERVQIGDAIEISVRHGYLDWPWVAELPEQ